MKKQDIKDLMKLFSTTENVSKMKLKHDDFEIELEKNTITQTVSNLQSDNKLEKISQEFQKPTVQDPSQEISGADVITSPMVGTFYQAPAPGAKPFVKIGDSVAKGQSVAIIEAMKIMNEIEAEFDCIIKNVLVNDGQPVEFGMPLFEVEKL